jgi:hypothetical protein
MKIDFQTHKRIKIQSAVHSGLVPVSWADGDYKPCAPEQATWVRRPCDGRAYSWRQWRGWHLNHVLGTRRNGWTGCPTCKVEHDKNMDRFRAEHPELLRPAKVPDVQQA